MKCPAIDPMHSIQQICLLISLFWRSTANGLTATTICRCCCSSPYHSCNASSRLIIFPQLRAGFDGEWLADLFLKDYTQYSTSGYYVDSVTIPRVKFNALVANKPNGVNKEFSFSLWVPPGSGEFVISVFYRCGCLTGLQVSSSSAPSSSATL